MGFMCKMSVFCCQYGTNAGEWCKVCDIATQAQNKQCSWQKKKKNFPAHCGSFSMSSLQTHEHRHWWASNVIQTHLEMCEERIKIKSHSAGKKNVHFFVFSCKLQCIFHVYGLVRVDINRLLSGSWCIISWVWYNYKAENIHKESFIIMGQSLQMNVGLITVIIVKV